MKKGLMLLGLVGLLIMTVPAYATAKDEMKPSFKTVIPSTSASAGRPANAKP